MFILFVMLQFVLERMVKRDMPVSACCLWLTHLGYSCKNSLYNHCQMSVRTYKGPALNSSFAMCSYKIQQHTVGGETEKKISKGECNRGMERKRFWKRGWQRLKKETILDAFSTDCVCVCFPQRERDWGKETDLIASQNCSKECLDLRFPLTTLNKWSTQVLQRWLWKTMRAKWWADRMNWGFSWLLSPQVSLLEEGHLPSVKTWVTACYCTVAACPLCQSGGKQGEEKKAGQRHGNSAAVKAARHMPGNRRERRDTHQTELMHDPAL